MLPSSMPGDKPPPERTDLRDYVDARVSAMRELSSERLESLKAHVELRFAELTVWREQRTIFVTQLIDARDKETDLKFDARDKALDIQAREYERRLGLLNHDKERWETIGATYVRLDLYAKDIARLDTERRDAQAAAEHARLAQHTQAESVRAMQDVSAETNRRSTVMGIVSAAIAAASVIASLIGHFASLH